MIIMNTEPRFFLNHEADRIAKELNEFDPDWQYKVVDFVNSGFSIIKVIDEEGITVGYWN